MKRVHCLIALEPEETAVDELLALSRMTEPTLHENEEVAAARLMLDAQ